MTFAKILREALDSQVRGWKAERDALQNRMVELAQAEARIAELDALIAEADDDSRETFEVAKREKPVKGDSPAILSDDAAIESKRP